MRERVVIVACFCVLSRAVSSEPALLNGDDLKTLLAGVTVRVDTPFGMTLPVKFASNGQMTGEAGGMSGFLGSPTDHGQWWADNDRLCQRWSRWFDREVQCLRVTRDGLRLQWIRDDGQKGTATLVAEMEPREKAPFALGAVEAAPPLPVPAPEQLAAKTIITPPAAVVTANAVAPLAPQKTAVPVRIASMSAAVVAPPKPAASNPSMNKPKVVVVAGAQITPQRITGYRVTGVAANDVLHIRAQPVATAPVIGNLAAYSRGLRLNGACVSDWCPVMQNGAVGWVGKHFLAEDRSVPSKTSGHHVPERAAPERQPAVTQSPRAGVSVP